jgi:deoxyribonuclease V
LAPLVVRRNCLRQVRRVAGVDTGFREGIARAAVVSLTVPELEPQEQTVAELAVAFPYVPGLLTYREGPAIMAALRRLKQLPDLLIFDGQGIAHPRRLGIASHIGVLTDIASIGCAKKRLIGRYAEPGNERGAYNYLYDGEETVGAVVRTRSGIKPVFVSIGHRVDLSVAVTWVLRCCRGYRLPETTRRADRLSRRNR